MIPTTYPVTMNSANVGDMVVYVLSSVVGLKRWSDYIPVKEVNIATSKCESHDNDGYKSIVKLSSTTGKQAWLDYIPVYIDSAATTPWAVNAVGYIPVGPFNFSGTLPTPALALNFTTGTLDSRVTFTRASGGTRVNSSGVIELMTTNTPRFDYDPVTLAAKGLLIEEQRTNLLLQSDTLSTQNVATTAVATTLSFYGTGTVVLSGTSTGTLVGTGAYPNRVSLTVTPTAGTLTLTVTGSVRFANLEAGAFATSYIPTTSAQATRAADVAVMTGTNFSTWYNQSEGTLYAEGSTFELLTGGFPRIAAINDGSNSNTIQISRNNSPSQARPSIVSGTVSQYASDIGAWTLGASAKIALAYKVNDFAATINSGTVSLDTLGVVPVVNRLHLGFDGTGGYLLNGHIKAIKYWNTRLTNAELQAATA
jgi:hypothetical protein